MQVVCGNWQQKIASNRTRTRPHLPKESCKTRYCGEAALRPCVGCSGRDAVACFSYLCLSAPTSLIQLHVCHPLWPMNPMSDRSCFTCCRLVNKELKQKFVRRHGDARKSCPVRSVTSAAPMAKDATRCPPTDLYDASRRLPPTTSHYQGQSFLYGDTRSRTQHEDNGRRHQRLQQHVQLCEFTLATTASIRLIVLQSPVKCCDIEPMPTSVLKGNIDLLAPILTDIINTSLETGVVPVDMKHALVTAILKKRGLDVKSLTNYRPISNLSFVWKTAIYFVERYVANELRRHIDANGFNDPF
ncbi:hypothetical protein LSAT2_029881 [Lamellibrachia satsuma]|nr:hypothetical protein LSAT2_029881 [Lamellibrachia satsuma]